MSNTAAQDSQSMDVEEIDENSEEFLSENEEEIATGLERLENSIQYNLSLGSRECCINSHSKAKMQCHCLSVLNGREDFCQAVAEYQLMFEKLSSVEKKKVVIEWMRANSNEGNKRLYTIPYILDSTDVAADYLALRNASICQSAMMCLLKKGYKWWKSCATHNRNMTVPSHKLTGQMSNKKRKFLVDYKEDLESHFGELVKEAEPIATRYVREVTGETTLRDNDDSMLYLPSFFTQRNCYAKFCLEKRGMKVTTNNKGTVKLEPAVAGEVKRVPSWSAYSTYWHTNYPKLKVRKPTEDICGYCYKFYNSHKFRGSNQSATADEGGDDAAFFDAQQEEEEEAEEEQINDATPADGVGDAAAAAGVGDTGVSVAEDTEAMENAILAAALHVKMARSMRQHVNEKIALSRQHRQESIPHCDRSYTYIADYCQNLALPHFGKEQPGDTYYLTPSKLEGFGVADVSHVVDGKDTDHLYFHCYKEGYGTKGGINVASMLMKTFRRLELLKEDSNGNPITGNELNIVMDNCGGQNKNNHVILLAPYLVERGFFKTVNMIFLVVGHTKNVCDRRFNNLKHDYHKSQVFSLDQAVSVLDKSPFVTVWPIDPDRDWYDLYTMLLKPYTMLAKAKLVIQKNHIFTATICAAAAAAATQVLPTTPPLVRFRFFTRQSALPEHQEVTGDIVNPAFAPGDGNRQELLASLTPERVLYKGLPGYKQILLYKSYIAFVPLQYHSDDLYQKPSKETVAAEKLDQKERKEYKKMKRERKTVAP
jgi:hypothetical protein